jgi:hypothetical protein
MKCSPINLIELRIHDYLDVNEQNILLEKLSKQKPIESNLKLY